MIRMRAWHAVPSRETVDALKKLQWATDGELSPGSNTVALMLFVALHFSAQDLPESEPNRHSERLVASASYEDLARAVGGVSRKLVSQGLTRLERLGLIVRGGSSQKRHYLLAKPRQWFKLPCSAIVRDGCIQPFKAMSLRDRQSLYAMKIYLYLAARRDNASPYSKASYEKICEATGVQGRHIRSALNVLVVSGLLAYVKHGREQGGEAEFGPNLYYLKGHGQLVNAGSASAGDSAPSRATAAAAAA